jgi:hypothetical protein
MLLLVVYLSAVLGGVLAYVYDARFGRIGLIVAGAAAVVMLTITIQRAPILLPVAIIGLLCSALAGREIARERRQRPEHPEE